MFKRKKAVLLGTFMAAVMLFAIPAYADDTVPQTGYITAPLLNVRSGPSTDYPVLGTLDQGEAVTILGDINGWDQINYNGQTAYIAGNYVTDDSSQAAAANDSSTACSNTDDAYSSSWTGAKLTPYAGTVQGPSGKETYYNLNMTGVINIMRNLGNTDTYWVRSDGCKMLGNYIMVAANLDVHPRGSLVETSLGTGIVCDTGTFAYSNPTQLDIAVNW